MKDSVRAYAAVLRLVRKLPPATRSYYAQFARENFVTYSDASDASSVKHLLLRAYDHTCWVLKKYGVDVAAAEELRQICTNP